MSDIELLEGEALQEALRALYEEDNQEEQVEVPPKPFTGEESFEEGGYYPNPGYDNFTGNLFGPDRMETPILDEEKDNPIIVDLVESEAYQNAPSSLARQRLIDEALQEQNMEIYRTKGEPALYGRKQVFENQDGEKRTYIVPKPGAESTGFQRGFMGGVLNAAKGLSEGVEKGFDIPFTNKRTYGTDDFLTDPDTDYVAENFPTYPADGAFEKIAQDIIPIVGAAIFGAKGVDKIDKLAGLSPKMTNWIAKRWDEAKKIDPQNSKRQLEKTLNLFMRERGANLAATMATPDDMEPLIGDDVAEYLGFDPETNKDLGHYIDNEAFTALGRVAIVTLGTGFRIGKEKLFPKLSKKSSKREAELGLLLLKQLDPGITDDMPPEIIAENARLLGQIIKNNKDFELGLLGQKTVKNADGTVAKNADGTDMVEDILPGGTLQLDSGTALFLGAKEYMEKSYGWLKETMSPEAYEQTIKEYTETFVNNAIGFKRSRQGRTTVQASDATVNAQANTVLESVADDAVAGGSKNADQAGVTLGEETLAPVTDALENVQKTRKGVEAAEATSDAVQDKNIIINMLEEGRDANALGGSVRANTENLQKITGEDLYNGWKGSFEEYNQAFKDLPEDIPVDMEDLTTLIDDLSKQTNDFDFITTTATKQDPFREMLKGIQARVVGTTDDGKAILETSEEIVERLSDIDLKYLYTKVRPAISDRLNLLERQGTPKPDALVKLKDWIDDAADASGETSFRAAMDMYEDHVKIYHRTDDLAQWEAQARRVKPQTEVAEGVVRGQEDAYELGMQMFLNAEQAATPGKMEAFLNALSKSAGKDVTPEIAEAYVGLTIRGLVSSTNAGTKVNSAQVRSSIQPYLAVLEQTNPKAVELFESAVKELELAEIGVANAKNLNDIAEKVYNQTTKLAQERAASKFINDLRGSNPSVMSDTSVVFKNIFDAKNSPDLVDDLLRQADEIGDPLIRDGIKSKFLSYLRDKVYVNQRMSSEVTEGGIGATNEVSPAQLQKILSGEFDSTVTTMRRLFDDEPEKADAVIGLLEILDVAVNSRAVRGSNFGSTTVLDQALKEKMNRLIVLTLGVLNPVATKARNIGAALIDGRAKEIQEAIEMQLDKMLIDPVYFNDVMNTVADNLTEKSLIRLMERNAIRSGTYLAKDRPMETLQPVPPEFEETQQQAQ